eukprot:m.592722 g.592722  ORF g.592722 m.592722 type:complete len:314 (+) comp58022_c0_seq6:43-984(+)
MRGVLAVAVIGVLLVTNILVLLAATDVVSFSSTRPARSHKDERRCGSGGVGADVPFLYLITPTYARPTQKADITRLCQTLHNVRNLHWIVIEDGEQTNIAVHRALEHCHIQNFTYISERTPDSLKLKICKSVDPRIGCPQGRVGKLQEKWVKHRGVPQRNAGLRRLREIARDNAVMYFADDDNTYAWRIFEEIRKTKRVSVFYIGLSGGAWIEGPKVVDGQFTGWLAKWRPDRKFPIDMAGLAINVKEVVNCEHSFPFPTLCVFISRPDMCRSTCALRSFFFHSQITSRPNLRFNENSSSALLDLLVSFDPFS